jgi:CHASE1-domain containing sensor protein
MTKMSSVGLLAVVAVLGGCGLLTAVAVLVVWAVLDNARRKAPRDQEH